jgi:hypothetical protein
MTPLKTYCLEDFSQNLLFFTYKGLKCKKKQRPARPSGHPHLSLSISSLGPVPFPLSLSLSSCLSPFLPPPAGARLPAARKAAASHVSLSPGGALRRRRGTHQVRPSPPPPPSLPAARSRAPPPPNPNANFSCVRFSVCKKADEHV